MRQGQEHVRQGMWEGMVSPDSPDEGLHRWHDVLEGQVAVGALLLTAVLQRAVGCGCNGGWQRPRTVPLCPPQSACSPPSLTLQPGPDPTTPRGSPSTGVRGLSLRDVRKRVRSLKLQLFCTLVGLEASGMSSVLGERCRGGPRCCPPRLPCRCGLLSRMRSLMPILLLRGTAGWAASEASGRRGDGDGDSEGTSGPPRRA